MKNIAVEKGLTNVIDFLSDEGYEIYEIDSRQKNSKDFIDGFDAIVLTGLNINFTGDHKTYGNAPVIDASGLTPEEIKDAIEKRAKS